MNTRALITATIGGATFASAGVLAHAGPLALARLAVLGAALVSAAFFDLAQRRIPNRIVLPAAVVCAALTLAAGAPLSLLAGLALTVRHGRAGWRTSLPMAPFLAVGALLTVIA